MDDKYNDIINLPHYQSEKRPHMSIHDRAAQFSPFAALTGHDEAIKETARLTDKKTELSETAKTIENTATKNITTATIIAIIVFVFSDIGCF